MSDAQRIDPEDLDRFEALLHDLRREHDEINASVQECQQVVRELRQTVSRAREAAGEMYMATRR